MNQPTPIENTIAVIAIFVVMVIGLVYLKWQNRRRK